MRRSLHATLRTLAISTAALAGGAAAASDDLTEMTLLTSWKAQAEQGGYYQAIATGLYEECGLEVSVRMGGPGIDNKQIFAGGGGDIMMASQIDDVFNLRKVGVPATAVMAGFQKNAIVLMTHAGNGIESLEDMKGRPILISKNSRRTFWPFLKARYGFEDSQIRPYTYQLGPFLQDEMTIQQSFITNEPYQVASKTDVEPNVFLLADHGYQPYGSVIVFRDAFIEEHPELVQCFVDASEEGFRTFFENPAPGLELIREDNPENPDDLVENSLRLMQEYELVFNETTERLGFGALDPEHIGAHFDMLVEAGIMPADLDWRSAFTTRFTTPRTN